MIAFESISKYKRNVILDTDIGPDCDDAGAIALLLYYKALYDFDILGIVNCTSNPYGNGAIDAICSYYGYELPIAQNPFPGFLDDEKSRKYNQYLSENFSRKFSAGQLKVRNAFAFYEEALTQAGDNGVVVIAIGPLTTVAGAFERFPDLFARKVHAIISMGGAFSEKYRQVSEFNIRCDIPAAKLLYEHFPNTLICTGLELGIDILSGFNAPDESNPVSLAYELFLKNRGEIKRASWDLTAVEFAVEGCGTHYKLSEPGILHIFDDGRNTFKACREGNRYYLKAAVPSEQIASFYNGILAQKPKKSECVG